MTNLLPTWSTLRTQATDLRRRIRAHRCTEAVLPNHNEHSPTIHPGYPRCTEAHPDTPGEWCDACQIRATARAELAMVKRQIVGVEGRMMRRLRREM